MELYGSLAWCFDLISTGEDHEKEADFVRTAAKTHKKSDGNQLLDVCCGHGWHDYFLKRDFEITGLDLNERVLDIARKRNPEVEYGSGDVDPNDSVAEGCMVFLIKEEGKDLDVHLLEAKTGLFELAEILRILEALDLETSLYDGDFDGGEYSEESPFPVFACVR